MIKKGYQISLITALCILINYVGKYMASILSVPLWLDSLGTAIAAYILGPVCGGIVGIAVNIMYGFSDPMSYIYALTNLGAGIAIGICAKKGMIEELFDVISTGALVTAIATGISTPLNCIFYSGYTGNVWGDGIFNMLVGWNFPRSIAALTAEMFLDFLDKTLTLMSLYFLVLAYRKIRRRINKRKIAAASITFLVFAGGVCINPISAKAAAPSNDYSFYIQTVYGNESGLLSGEANDIVFTEDGVLWIGTYAGLYRYAGRNFEYMNQYDSIKNVNCFYLDAEGRLWIGTNDDGLSLSIDSEVINSIDEENGLPSNSVRAITQQKGGDYFVGTSSELAIVRNSSEIIVTKTFPEIAYTESLSADKNGAVAAVTSAGELFLIQEKEIVDSITDKEEDEKFTCCLFDDEGNLYVGTDKGKIYVYSISRGKFALRQILFDQNPAVINSLYFTEKEELFVCTDAGIVYTDSSGIWRNLNTNNFNNSIDHMVEDYQGNLWFSSSRLGVMKMSNSAFTEVYEAFGMSPEVVNSVQLWDGNLYFGTDTGLDVVKNGVGIEVDSDLARRLAGARVRCLMTDSQDNLWISSYGHGVFCVQKDGTIRNYTERDGALGSKFRCSYELSDGTIAVSSDLGISFIKDGKVTGTIGAEDGLSNILVLTFTELEDGTLLAGTDGGGITVIKDYKVTGVIGRKDGLGSGVVLRTVRDKTNDGAFIVTSNGVCYLDEQRSVRELSNFPYTNNYDIYDDGEGNLFVTGSAGIYIVDKEELLSGETISYEVLNYLNGLRASFTANAWNYVGEDNNWYIANSSGVTKLDLKRYNFSHDSYRMLLDRIKVDDTTYRIERGEELVVPREAKRIELHPEIVNYSVNDPYVSYYLEGIDEKPTVVRQSDLQPIVYANLPAGQYKFHLAIVRKSTGRAIEESVYEITKETEIYDFLWFKIYFFAEFIFIISWLTWFLTRIFLKRTVELQKRELALAKEQLAMGNETILTIARTVDAKDSNTNMHSARVSEYSVLIGAKLGYSEEEQENLRKAALLHDIGKIGIPDRILNKPSRLTDEEYMIMKSHVIRGGEILKDFTLIPHVEEGAKYHHERYDGTGYMQGLAGDEIPEWARIIGIADAFDAMTANRVYRKKMDISIVLEEIRKGRGTQFDPRMVDIMLGLIEDGSISVEELYKEDGEHND